MATSSKFILLNDAVLMEYIYADQENINTPGNPYRISTSVNALWKTQNLHTNEDQVLNADTAEILKDNLPQGTANVRNHSFAKISESKIAYLDIDRVIFYNDYDTDLTPTASLPIAFTSPKSPVYDTIKLHLVQGFNFQGNEGFAFTVKAKRQDNKNVCLANLLYTKADSWETMNPNSFLFAGRVYDSYIELRVLSLYNLLYDYWNLALTGDTVAERITNFKGLTQDQNIQLEFNWLYNPTFVDGQNYQTINESIKVDIATQDQFSSISAYIAESTDGDYIEFYGKYNGSIIENFILDINNSGYDYMILHDLLLYEYVYDQTSQTYAWVKTADLQLSQVDNYDLPNVYRPVIKNGNAISFKIEYTMRLYNRNDNSQIWKTSSIISPKVNKYGRTLKAINLGTNPVQIKVYNQLITKEINLSKPKEQVISNVKYLTSFTDNNAVLTSFDLFTNATSAATQNSSRNALVSLGGTQTRLYGQGLGRILITQGTSYVKFTLFQRKNNQNVALDLSGLGDLILSFRSKTGDEIVFDEFPTTFTQKSRGEVVFRLNDNQSTKILGLISGASIGYTTTRTASGISTISVTDDSSRTFTIYIKNENNEKQLIYTGKFYSQQEYNQLREIDEVSNLNEVVGQRNTTINERNTEIALKNTQIGSQNVQIQGLLASNNFLNQQITGLSQQVSNLQNSIRSLNTEDAAEDAAYEKTIRDLQKIVGDKDNNLSRLTNQTNQLQSTIIQLQNQITTLQNQNTLKDAEIARLRNVPAPIISIQAPRNVSNFGVTSSVRADAITLSSSNTPSLSLVESKASTLSASIANTQVTSFTVTPTVSATIKSNQTLPVVTLPKGTTLNTTQNVIKTPTVSVPAPFQNFGISTKGSASKGTSQINFRI
jgi:hypothetical protein